MREELQLLSKCMWKNEAIVHKRRTENQEPEQEKKNGKLKVYVKCKGWYCVIGIMVESEMH